MINVDSITKKNKNRVILRNFSYKFEDAGFYLITGGNGSGKSTLIKMLAGILKPDDGDIYYTQEGLTTFSKNQRSDLLANIICYVDQNNDLINNLTVYQNLMMPDNFQNNKINDVKINEYFNSFEINNILDRKVKKLSGGEKKVVSFIKMLLRDNEILLLDEITSSLDKKNKVIAYETLKKLSKEKLIILVSHERDIAKQFADEIIEISENNLYNKKIEERVLSPINNSNTEKQKFSLRLSTLIFSSQIKFNLLLSIWTILLFLLTFFMLNNKLYDRSIQYYNAYADSGEELIKISYYDNDYSNKKITVANNFNIIYNSKIEFSYDIISSFSIYHSIFSSQLNENDVIISKKLSFILDKDVGMLGKKIEIFINDGTKKELIVKDVIDLETSSEILILSKSLINKVSVDIPVPAKDAIMFNPTKNDFKLIFEDTFYNITFKYSGDLHEAINSLNTIVLFLIPVLIIFILSFIFIYILEVFSKLRNNNSNFSSLYNMGAQKQLLKKLSIYDSLIVLVTSYILSVIIAVAASPLLNNVVLKNHNLTGKNILIVSTNPISIAITFASLIVLSVIANIKSPKVDNFY